MKYLASFVVSLIVIALLATSAAYGALCDKNPSHKRCKPSAQPVPPPSNVAPATPGVSPGGKLIGMSDAELGRLLDEAKRAGAQWVRVDVAWSVIQSGGPTSWDWSSSDRIISFISARGMNVHAMLGYTPSWARPAATTDKHAPLDPNAYANFARATAQRYGAQGVHVYEIWNEPNINAFWQPKPDPVAYANLLKLAAPAIREADPSAHILNGGTSPALSDGTNVSPVDFLSALYKNGAGTAFDAVSHHPYCSPAYPGDAQSWSAWYQMYGTSPSLRSVMEANGDADKKIWISEFGAPTNGPVGSGATTEADQAAMLTRAFEQARSYSWAGPLEWYSVHDNGTDPADRENFYGMLRYDWSEKPSFAAYQTQAIR